jgi:hypothetical protein
VQAQQETRQIEGWGRATVENKPENKEGKEKTLFPSIAFRYPVARMPNKQDPGGF